MQTKDDVQALPFSEAQKEEGSYKENLFTSESSQVQQQKAVWVRPHVFKVFLRLFVRAPGLP